MARFKYLGEPPRPFVKTYGDTHIITVHLKNGTVQELTPTAGDHFVIGADIGYDITDERALRTLRADSRFQEIV